MKKIIFVWSLMFCFFNAAHSEEWNINIFNVSDGVAGKAEIGNVIKVVVTKPSTVTSFPVGPYFIVLDNQVLNIQAIDSFENEGKTTKSLFFLLDWKEIKKYLNPEKDKIEVTIKLADKSKAVFPAQPIKQNLELIFPEKKLVLLDNTFRLDRQFEVRIDGYSRVANLPDDLSKIGLYFNDILVTHAKVMGSCIHKDTITLSFGLDSAGMTKLFYRNNSEEKVKVGIGNRDKCLIDTGNTKPLSIMFMRPHGKLMFWCISFLFALLLFWLCRNTNLIKDSFTVGEHEYRPYSLSRTQFAIWTFVIVISLIYIWFTTKEMASLPSSTFILLGISALVKLTSWFIEGSTEPGENSNRKASVVSSSKRNKEGKVPQFLRDLISDASGVSIHRLQNLLFTVFLAIFFWWEVLSHLELPVISTNMLALLGVSGAAYTLNKKEEGGGKPNGN